MLGNTKQGHGSDSPQSYLANARTNINWKSKSDSNFKVNEKRNNENLNPKKNETFKDRIIKGRKFWPSDPIVIEVLSNGEIVIKSSVLKCAHWDRVLIDNKSITDNITKNKKFENVTENKIEIKNSNVKISETNTNHLIENNFYKKEYVMIIFMFIFIGFVIFSYRCIRSCFSKSGNKKSSNKESISNTNNNGKYSRIRQNNL